MVPGGLWHIRPKECQSARRRAGIGPPWLCRDVGIVGPLSGVPFFAVSFCCGSHPDQLTASVPVLDRYCFTLNFGHATGASLHSHNVPIPALSIRSKVCARSSLLITSSRQGKKGRWHH